MYPLNLFLINVEKNKGNCNSVIAFGYIGYRFSKDLFFGVAKDHAPRKGDDIEFYVIPTCQRVARFFHPPNVWVMFFDFQQQIIDQLNTASLGRTLLASVKYNFDGLSFK